MDRFAFPSPLGGGTPLSNRRPNGRWILGLLLLVLAASLFAVPGHAGPGGVLPDPARVAVATPHPSVITSHGDLVVGPGNSPYVISPGSAAMQTYYQGGNVTVQPGGKLLILQTDFEFVQYIGATGSLASRLGHIFTFNDQGTVWLQSSVLTADLGVLNAYPKVTLNVTAPGQMYVNSSSLAFAGSIGVYGAGAGLWVNGSVISPNPLNALLPNVSQPANTPITNDSLYSPMISVTGGGQLTLGGSSELRTYADNWTQSGAPQPNPVTDTASTTISSTQSTSYGLFSTANDPLSLLRDTLYRTVSAGSVTIDYSATVDEQSTSGNQFFFNVPANLGTISYPSAGSSVTVPLPSAALSAIDAAGVPAFFAALSTVSVNLGTTNSVTAVTITEVSVSLTAGTSFNITVNGTGSVLTAVDSSLDVNWYPVAPFPKPPTAPPANLPWASKKVLLENHARAYIGNLSVSTVPNPGNATDISAILPDATSTANFYRWMFIPVFGAGTQPVAGATAVAYYAYDTNQLDNATATALNNLTNSDPALGAYASAWDAAHNVASYGQTNPNTGEAALLLASGQLTEPSLQDGIFFGTYHVVVTVAGGRAGPPSWFTGSVSAYPTNMAPSVADVQTPLVFPLYRPALAVGFASISVGVGNGTSNTNDTLAIGEYTNFTITISNIGTGAVGSYDLVLNLIPTRNGLAG
ncbi:MAG TPA: hypothetical protein VJQ43_02485, partial [Thermoplasmata archaeon]|nr:hypothetical protein [Thermoplasmata archaeon]